ncbi:MAG: type II toxin-antitoxin system VapC family toxin [Verrucomicrobia bacterium]|nr:type II toxin-antitoxin system VapC family toxin [Verrucomicrobiota bacterium]
MKLYLDSAYIAKCYLRERGTDEVLDLVEASSARFSSEWAMLEVVAVFHRHFREGKLSRTDFEKTVTLFRREAADGIWQWLPVDSSALVEATERYLQLAPGCFLRSADCMHLVTACRAGFSELYTNDKRLLDVCPYFGIRGMDVVGG